MAVIRFDRGMERHDTIAWVWVPEFQYEDRGGRQRMVQVMLDPADEWAVRADGSLAIVRANGYSVEWVSPDGSRVIGPPTPFRSFPLSGSDKEAAMSGLADNAMTSVLMISAGGGGRSMQMRRGLLPGSDGPSADDFWWAETLPPFRSSSAQVSPRGDLWVERMSPAGEAGTLDVFDRTGTRIGEVALPPGRRLIGFGAGAVAYWKSVV